VAALLARVEVTHGIGFTDGDEQIALEIDPVEDGTWLGFGFGWGVGFGFGLGFDPVEDATHRALEAVLGHATHVGLHA